MPQLDLNSLRALGLSLQPAGPRPKNDVPRVLKAFQGQHDPFSRADVVKVLQALGHGGPPGKWSLDATVKKLSVKVGHGKYSPKKLKAEPDQEAASFAAKSVAVTPPAEVTLPEKTLTYTWIVKQIQENHLNDRVSHLVRRKNPHMSWDEIRSFVDMWLMTYGERGTCDKYIAAGKPPTSSILAVWVNHKLRQSTYHDAQDALNREFMGLRTQKEIMRRKDTGSGDYIMPGAELCDPTAHDIAWESGKSETDAARPVVVERTFEEAFDEQQLSLVTDLLSVRHTRAKGIPYSEVFSEAMAGKTLGESALLQGCSKIRISNLRQNVRSTLKDLPVVLEMAHKVLRLLADEPYSTLQELTEDISPKGVQDSLTPRVREVLDLLVVRGLVSEHQGESFASTSAGHQASHHQVL